MSKSIIIFMYLLHFIWMTSVLFFRKQKKIRQMNIIFFDFNGNSS